MVLFFVRSQIESKSERVVGLEMQMDFAIRALRNDRCVAQKVVMSSSFFDIVCRRIQ